MKAALDEVLSFVSSTLLCNVLLVGLLALTLNISGSQKDILLSLKKGERFVSTTYTDVYGMSHTVNSPLQPTPIENTRVHKEYLTQAFCEFTPQNPPTWWHPEDCR